MARGRADVVVSADAVAWAVVASARAYGDDPVAVLTGEGARRYGARRCLAPAIVGLARATGAQEAGLARMLGMPTGTIQGAKANQKGRYREALAAVIEAVGLVLEDEAAEGAGEPEPEPELLPEPPPEPVSHASLTSERVAADGALALRFGIDVAAAGRPDPIVAAPFKPMPVIYRGDPTPSAPLGARILDALGRAPGTPRGLATVLDAKEELVGREITRLAHEGAIEPGPMPESGRRDQRWKLVKG